METKVCTWCKREFPSTNIYYFRRKSANDGLHRTCKECEGHEFIQPNLKAKQGYKICYKCKREFPATFEYFTKNIRGDDGLQPQCRSCRGRDRHRKVVPKSNKDGYKFCGKCLREFPATTEYFLVYSKDKLQKQCRECMGKSFKHPIEVKTCRVCKNTFPATREFFYVNRSILLGACKKCTNLKRYPSTKKYLLSADAKKHQKDKMKEWRKSNPDKLQVNRVKRRTLKRGLPSTFTVNDWHKCKEHFNGKCAYCGYEGALSQDHFIALSKGGEYTKNNIIPVCGNCNTRKNNKNFFEWYPKQEFYSKKREQKILKYLNYDKKTQCQQLTLSI